MATVNEDGSPHNTPYRFMIDERLENLYWGSHPESQHSKNVLRNGQVFVVLYDANESGGLYIEASEARDLADDQLETALAVHNLLRQKEGKEPLELEYYKGKSPQRMYGAKIKRLWVNLSDKDDKGRVTRDYRQEVSKQELLNQT